MAAIERGIEEVCNEALHFLRGECEPDDMVFVKDFVGYFDEILAICNEFDDDGR